TVALVTAHLPLREVAATLNKNEIVRVGLLLEDFLHRRRIPRPRIAVAGFNPHAGEAGAFGREEIEMITPAIAELNSQSAITSHQSPTFAGPFSPDTLFHHAANAVCAGVLCTYHNQELIRLPHHAF